MITASLSYWHVGEVYTYRLTVAGRCLTRVVSRRELEADPTGVWARAAERWTRAQNLLLTADRLVADATPFGATAAHADAQDRRGQAQALQLAVLAEIFPEASKSLSRAVFVNDPRGQR